LGRIGLTFAEYLAKQVQPRLVLIDLFEVPPKSKRRQWLKQHQDDDALRARIQKIEALEKLGAEVVVHRAAVEDEKQMQAVIDQTMKKFGQLNGVIHAAGIVGEKSIKAIPEMDAEFCDQQFQPKIYGTMVLEKVLTGIDTDFCILQSSLSSILGGLGMGVYAAANSFLDAFCHRHNQADTSPWTSVNWEGWLFQGDVQDTGIGADMIQLALTPEQGIEAFERILAMKIVDQVIVSTGDLQARIDQWLKMESRSEAQPDQAGKATSLHPRPNLPNPYVAPRNELEQEIVAMWQELLGIDRIGIYDNFFELGGHSLLATQLVSRMRDQFTVELPLRELFESPTIATLSESIVKERSQKQQTDEDLAKLLEMVEQMSDEEAKALLEKKKTT